MNNPRAPAITAIEHVEVGSCVENDMHEVKEDVKKKEEHIYRAMSTVTLSLSPVYIFFRLLIFSV